LAGGLSLGAGCGARTSLSEATPDAGAACAIGSEQTCSGEHGCVGSRICEAEGVFGECRCAPVCSDRTYTAEPHPISIYLIVDRSGSMIARWNETTSALGRFVSDPGLAGLEVGLGFFPVANDVCTPRLYEAPEVPFGPLGAAPASGDPQERALLAAFEASYPRGSTPMFAGMRGAMMIARAHAKQASPNERTLVVLVTDGTPTTCAEGYAEISSLVKSEFSADPPIRTYAIGLSGSDESVVSGVAASGGGESFFLGDSDVASQLLAALVAIKGFLGCDFTAEGVELDQSTPVSLSFTSSGQNLDFERVAGAATCGDRLGWYLEAHGDAGKDEGSHIRLCPSSCVLVNRGDYSQLRIRAGACE